MNTWVERIARTKRLDGRRRQSLRFEVGRQCTNGSIGVKSGEMGRTIIKVECAENVMTVAMPKNRGVPNKSGRGSITLEVATTFIVTLTHHFKVTPHVLQMH